MYKDLKNKVAVVTGGSKGIGRAVAERFGKEQMRVVVNYNSDAQQAAEAVQAIEAQGGQAVSVHGDVSSEPGSRDCWMPPCSSLAGSMCG